MTHGSCYGSRILWLVGVMILGGVLWQAGSALAQKRAGSKARTAKKAPVKAPGAPGAPVAGSARAAKERPPVEAEDHERSYDDPGEAVEYERWKRAPAGETAVPVERYLVAREKMRVMRQYSTPEGRMLPSRAELVNRPEQNLLTWAPLGPGNIGGRTRALLIHPTTPNTMYAAGVAGGVWKTTNGGVMWQALADMIANIAVSALAFDPNNPEILYAGTGEGYFNSDSQRGLGVFKTTDGGMTWQALASTQNTDFNYVNDIVVSPGNTQRLYAATRTGIHRSTDGGATWAQVYTSFERGGCLDLVIRTDQTTSDQIVAACGSSPQSVVLRNADAAGAGVWSSVINETGMGRATLAIAPSNQSIVYAAVASAQSGSTFFNGFYAIFRSNDGGATWQARVRNTDTVKLNTVLFSNTVNAFNSQCGFGSDRFLNQGWYDNAIAVDPTDPERIWVGGVDMFRSDDGGANFGLASHWWAAESNPRFVHADQHRIVFHPQYNGTTNQTMFIGNDGGIFRTDNARGPVATTINAPCSTSNGGVFWTSINNNYGVTQFYHGAPYPDGRSYFGGAQDNGTLRGNEAAGLNAWDKVFGGDGGYVAVDPTNPRTIYFETQNLALRKSVNNGSTVRTATTGIDNTGFLFIVPFTMDPSDPQRLWTGGGALWRTTNGAINWQQASTALPSSVTAVAVAPQDANRVLAGLSSGRIHRQTEALLTTSTTVWESSTPRGGVVSWLAFDPNNSQVAYATYSSFGGAHVWRSTDGGVSWAAIDGSGATSIPDIPVHTIVIDPTNTARLYVGTDLGVFVSLDAGASWSVENTGFANVITETLAVNTVNGVTQLFAFTHGRGAYRTTLNQIGCNYALLPKTVNTAAGALSDSVSVSAGPNGCEWTGQSNVPWIQLAPGASGNGNGTVGYTVEPNPGSEPRAGTATIAGRSFTVVQEGQPDREAPSVQITSPAASPFLTVLSVVTLTGTASDQLGVESVIWSTDRGQSGTATGTTNWTITNASLSAGANTITVTALDAFGNASRTTLLVISNSQGPSADQIAPTIAITAPTSMPTFTTSTLPITILGTAADNTQLTHVSWSNDRGGSGTASGTTTWSIAGVPVQVGVNRLTVTAWDGAGNSKSATLEVTTTPSQVLTRIAGNLLQGYTGDGGAAVEGRLSLPRAVAVDGQGVVYFTDTDNNAIRCVGLDGVVTTIAGTGTDGYGGDGGPATSANLNGPRAIVFDETGNIYFSDTANHAVRRISLSGVITTIAGNGNAGSTGDGGPATSALLNGPLGLAFDSKGDLYIVDTNNHRVRKITMSTGVITRVVGTGAQGFSGDDGPALSAALRSPSGIAIDKNDNLYIVDQGNARVRKVTAATGNISTIIGTGTQGFGGDGGPGVSAQINQARLIAVDAAGVLYLADQSNHRIRRYGTDGMITTLAGTGAGGSAGEGAAPAAAQLSFPTGVAIDAAGVLYIADGGNHRILRVSAYGRAAAVSAASFRGPALAPDSIAAVFSGENLLATGTEVGSGVPLPTSLAGTTLRVRDSLGNEYPTGQFFVSPGQINFYLPPGVATGPATLLARSGAGDVTLGGVDVSAVAPGIFTANQNGAGVPAANALRVRADGAQIAVQVAQLSGNQFTPIPIDLGPPEEQVFLVLFGTGLRNRALLPDVKVTIGGIDCEVLYAGPQGSFIGLDQINVRFSRALIGRGEVDVVVTVGGVAANTVRVAIN